MIKLMADSTCDLSDEILEKYDISLAPLSILIEGKTYKDRLDISPDEFYSIIDELDENPTTSMPSPPEYVKIFEEAIEKGYDEILCISMSSGTSGSYQSAELAKDYFFESNPDSKVRIYIVDSKCMSHGSGWLLLKTARLREKGSTFEELIDFAEMFKTNVKHYLAVNDLDNLIKSGRLSNASAMIGKLLKINPIMSMKNGKGAIVAKERGRKKVLKHYVDNLITRINLEISDFLIIGYTSDKLIAENLKNKILKEADYSGEIFIMQMGVSVGTHVGLGGISLYFVEKSNKKDGLLINEIHSLVEKKNDLLKIKDDLFEKNSEKFEDMKEELTEIKKEILEKKNEFFKKKDGVFEEKKQDFIEKRNEFFEKLKK
ncbi:DegV family protein [Clostridium grantii]|uniref:EDD domain protein, DegV family n=1 Tax=Clostridium grantii DSM 8605 TaxID=1121316 RepID=A0A1M5VZ62_9CLOT|nr:DegV family protein [Clostridium grantii]SHH80468.1 EDD domain protein, DegV family [Clostridium grantii DSM 8605]